MLQQKNGDHNSFNSNFKFKNYVGTTRNWWNQIVLDDKYFLNLGVYFTFDKVKLI